MYTYIYIYTVVAQHIINSHVALSILSTGFKPSYPSFVPLPDLSIHLFLSPSLPHHTPPPLPILSSHKHYPSPITHIHPIKPTRDHLPHPYQKRDHLKERRVILCTRFLTLIRDTRTRKKKVHAAFF